VYSVRHAPFRPGNQAGGKGGGWASGTKKTGNGNRRRKKVELQCGSHDRQELNRVKLVLLRGRTGWWRVRNAWRWERRTLIKRGKTRKKRKEKKAQKNEQKKR